MSSFTPVYRPPTHRQSFLARELKRERKRKRNRHADEAAEQDLDTDRDFEPETKDEARASGTSSIWHPVNKTDQFYVAGVGRNESLPGGNFPHASPGRRRRRPVIKTELAELNLPTSTTGTTPGTQDGSLKRRHLDNLTAILHMCILSGDWDRASRAWGLILRTEIQGRGVDIRHNGRWLVGGEILMRRSGRSQEPPSAPEDAKSTQRKLSPNHNTHAAEVTDDGFRLVREYYERMTLQYPHMPRQSHTTVNALAIYPALFNVWVYAVQDRALRASNALVDTSQYIDDDTISESGHSEKSISSSRRIKLRSINTTQFEEALTIADRMDNLMLIPPYDRSIELLHLRAMISLWMCDLHCIAIGNAVATTAAQDDPSPGGDDHAEPTLPKTLQSRSLQDFVAKERESVARIMQVMQSVGAEVPNQLSDFLEEDSASRPDDEN